MNEINTIISTALSRITEDLPNLNLLFEKKISRLNITKHQAYQILGLDKNTITPILDYSAKSVDIFNLLKIAEFLDIKDIELLTQIYCSNLSSERISELEKVKKANFIIKNFNLDILKKCGFLKGSINDFDAIEKTIINFFGLGSLYQYTDSEYSTLFSKTKRASPNKMLFFWLRSALYQFKKINNPYTYDREYLKDLITKIKPYCRDEDEGFVKVIKALYKAGVTVIVQPHLSTTQIRGATFIINEKPCIVITNLNDNYSSVWFALLHELCHALFDYELISENKFHLSLDSKTSEDIFFEEKIEEYANNFARDYFLQESQINYIIPFLNNPYLVNQYAAQQNIHASIIYNFCCWHLEHKHNKKQWAFYQKYFTPAKKMLSKVNLIPFDSLLLEETILKHKTNLETQNVLQYGEN